METASIADVELVDAVTKEVTRFREVWRDGLWTKEEDEEMVIEKMEAQAWICLYNLLSTREVAAFVFLLF